ncbi:MAG: hypothetical protein KBS99_01985 [Prevotellaceae bacterium]|nr:hypothetical protein [Candidatus Colivivens caballi]
MKKVYTFLKKGVQQTAERCTPKSKKVYTFFNLRALVKENMSGREGKHERSQDKSPKATLQLPYKEHRRSIEVNCPNSMYTTQKVKTTTNAPKAKLCYTFFRLADPLLAKNFVSLQNNCP